MIASSLELNFDDFPFFWLQISRSGSREKLECFITIIIGIIIIIIIIGIWMVLERGGSAQEATCAKDDQATFNYKWTVQIGHDGDVDDDDDDYLHDQQINMINMTTRSALSAHDQHDQHDQCSHHDQ